MPKIFLTLLFARCTLQHSSQSADVLTGPSGAAADPRCHGLSWCWFDLRPKTTPQTSACWPVKWAPFIPVTHGAFPFKLKYGCQAYRSQPIRKEKEIGVAQWAETNKSPLYLPPARLPACCLNALAGVAILRFLWLPDHLKGHSPIKII